MLAVMLVGGIIALINSIPLSIRSIYEYSSESLGVSPRGISDNTPEIVKSVIEKSPYEIEKTITCRVSQTQVQSIVGKWPFVVIGMNRADMDFYLNRQKVQSVLGKYPTPGKPEVLISEPVARNLNLKIGSVVQGPELNESYSPFEVKVVGIAKSTRWLMVSSVEYLKANHFPPIDLAMIFTKKHSEQDAFDRWAFQETKGKRAQVYAFFQIEKNSQEMFKTLYRILDVVVGMLVVVITFMMGMLINIYQSQRIVEFGLLQALGYTRKELLLRVFREVLTVVMLGWFFGLLGAFGLLKVLEATLMAPRAFFIDPFDLIAFRYTIPIPFAIMGVALVSVSLKFRKFDPVSIVERRLV